jgi:hypothetical protein
MTMNRTRNERAAQSPARALRAGLSQARLEELGGEALDGSFTVTPLGTNLIDAALVETTRQGGTSFLRKMRL